MFDMADFFLTIPPPLTGAMARVHDESYTCTTCMLVGPPQSGKSSMAFAKACHVAQRIVSADRDDAECVVVVCSRRKLAEQPLPAHARGAVADRVLRAIEFKFIEDEHTLVQYCAHAHMLRRTPRLLVVEDIARFHAPSASGGSTKGALAKMLAHITDAAFHFSQQLRDGGACDVLVTALGVGEPMHSALVQKWIQLLVSIEESGAAKRVAPRVFAGSRVERGGVLFRNEHGALHVLGVA